MSKKFMQFFGMFLLAGGLLMTSCTDDTTDPTPTAATVNLGTGAGYISGNAEIETGSTFTVNVIANAGTNPMKVITVYKDNVAIDFNDLTYNGSGATSNPAILFNTDKTSLDWEIGILSDNTDGSHDYKFEIEDEGGLKNSVTISIMTVTSATPVDSLMGILFNQAGPTGTGGLDLDMGIGTGSADPIAEIRDQGIDIGLPNPTNWKQRISGVNGSTIRKAAAGTNFTTTASKEAILDAWNAGTDKTESDKIAQGDIYLVKNGMKYYMIYFSEVNIVTTDNSDNYVIDIKK
ncbi:MAG: hypothetical protein R2787_03140 [Saprospiraceae bacterium]